MCGIIDAQTYQTKGDANNADDVEPVKFENIEGKYVFKIPKIGYIIIWAQNKTGIIIICLIIYLLYFLNKKTIERKIERREKREIYNKITNKDE